MGVPTPFDTDIENAIHVSTHSDLGSVIGHSEPARFWSHVIKYTAASYGGKYPPGSNAVATPGLFVSSSPGFTWGNGLYVSPIAFPVSTAIYGRCGVVAELPDVKGWRVFNATDPNSQALYIQWVQRQPIYSMLTLTAHANWANHLLRNLFKSRFEIDVVLFAPDEFNSTYTDRTNDIWLSISEWTRPAILAHGVPSTRAISPRLTVVLAEEFELTLSGIRRQTLIGPTPTLSSMLPQPADILRAYAASDLLWVGA